MKKKRFLKLVMSYGIQRDKAARMAARAFGDMFAAMGTALAACFSPALRGYVDDAKGREQKQADFRRREMCSCRQRMKS